MDCGTCILVVDDHCARFCVNDGGGSRVDRVLDRPAEASLTTEEGHRLFAWRLMSELYREVQTRLPQGIVIVASPAMLEELDQLMIPQIRKLIIAEIARGTQPEETCSDNCSPAVIAMPNA